MDARLMKALAGALAPVIREAVDAATEPLLVRIASLEARQPEKGEKGDPGPAGTDGREGARGPQGPAGERGEKGEKGDPGPAGERGPVGERGAEGLPGRDGRDGLAGKDGRDGAPGERGLDGKDGRDGQDGLGFDDLDVIYDGERTFTFRWWRGERIEERCFIAPITIDRGVYKPGETYERGDGVSYGGSFWIAQERTSEKPDGGKGWRLAVKRGRDGKDGTPPKDTPPKPVKVG